MARFSTTGLDALIDQVAAMGLAESELADKMLIAGAEKVKEAWKQAAALHGLRITGDMINSIGFSRAPRTIDGIRQIDIYPQGKDRKGVSNAEKAFILHYGTKSESSVTRGIRKALKRNKKYHNPGIPATHWVDDAEELAAQPVQDAMEQVFNDYLHEKGLI